MKSIEEKFLLGSQIDKALTFIQNSLSKFKIPNKETIKSMLTAEEIMVKMKETAPESESVNIQISKSFSGTVSIKLTAKGTCFSLDQAVSSLTDLSDTDYGPEADETIRNLILKNFRENINLEYIQGNNIARIIVNHNKGISILTILSAMAAGILFGAVVKNFASPEIANYINSNILTSVSKMFLNAIKMVMTPLIFFSIASSVADMNDLKSLGRIGSKVTGFYFLTSLMAILLSITVYNAVKIGNTELANAIAITSETAGTSAAKTAISIKNTIINIVPDNMTNPFLKSDMLQVIFIALVFGLATSIVSKKYPLPKDFVIQINAVFRRIATLIMFFLPVSVFCSMATMVITLKAKTILFMTPWIGTIYLTHAVMFLFYALLILLIGRLNPLKFFKKYFPSSFTAFTYSASNPTLPLSMNICEKKLGISKKIYSFSIPLGISMNMDGSCIFITITTLFLAKIFGITIDSTSIFNLIFAVFFLTIGTPGVPGACLVCLALVLPIAGVPVEAMGLIIGLYQFNAMIQSFTNVTGDGVISLTVASIEKLLDKSKYNS